MSEYRMTSEKTKQDGQNDTQAMLIQYGTN